MTSPSDTNKRTPSTRWEMRKVRIKRRPPGPEAAAAKQPRPALGYRNPATTLTITVRSLGGSEAWWEITARGRTWRVPGHRFLEDALLPLYYGEGGRPQQARKERQDEGPTRRAASGAGRLEPELAGLPLRAQRRIRRR